MEIILIIGDSGMEITVERMAMIREDYNPKNTNLNLDLDWSVEYTNTDQREIHYDIVLKSVSCLNLNFKVEGLIILGIFEEFVQQECSQIVFNHACTMLVNVFSLTRQSNYELLEEDINSTVNFDTAF